MLVQHTCLICHTEYLCPFCATSDEWMCPTKNENEDARQCADCLTNKVEERLTGRQLINILQKLSPAELNLEVELYLVNSEDGEAASTVRVRSSDKAPYYKGDNPWRRGDVKSDVDLIYIGS